jgi:hypothetical protein
MIAKHQLCNGWINPPGALVSINGKAWRKLHLHRARAARVTLDILVWGPGASGGTEYQTRCQIRKRLEEAGHNARFSEDLCTEDGALDDPLSDELLQADAAHAIVVLYGSRGSQTERDTILVKPKIASKVIFFIEKSMYSAVTKSISGKSWEEVGRLSRIIIYDKKDLQKVVVQQAYDLMEKARRALYMDYLQRSYLNG